MMIDGALQEKKPVGTHVVLSWVTIILFLSAFPVSVLVSAIAGASLPNDFLLYIALHMAPFGVVIILGVCSLIIARAESKSEKFRKTPLYLIPVVITVIICSVLILPLVIVAILSAAG
jgi:hypothetical protein